MYIASTIKHTKALWYLPQSTTYLNLKSVSSINHYLSSYASSHIHLYLHEIGNTMRELQLILASILFFGCSAISPRALSTQTQTAAAFAPPLGIGAVLFKPRVNIVKSDGDDDRLVDAGKFFVDAFW